MSNHSENIRVASAENLIGFPTLTDREETISSNNHHHQNNRGSHQLHQHTPIINVRKRFLAATNKQANSGKRIKPMEVNEIDHSENGGGKRPNFSALGNLNLSITKTPSNTSKPGDIRKLVIKNFKCK